LRATKNAHPLIEPALLEKVPVEVDEDGGNKRKGDNIMSNISMKLLLESGVHFGHQTNKWNPKMKQYIFGARNGIYIIDLQQTVELFNIAFNFVAKTISEGKELLFLGTKKQAQESIKVEAERAAMPYVNQRWLGGMLTNFNTIKKSIDRLNTLDKMFEDESINAFPKKEILGLRKEKEKLEKVLGGIRYMKGLPGALFVVDPKKEYIAVREARKLGVPIVGIVDTNCNPDDIDYVIPGNDDAIRAIKLFALKIADAVLEGKRKKEEIIQSESDKEAASAGPEVVIERAAAAETDVPDSIETKDSGKITE